MTNPASTPLDAFIAENTHEFSLRDGTHLRVRPIHPDDKEALRAGFERLSPAARYRRFLSPMGRLSDRSLRYFTEIDYHDHFAWAAIDLGQPGEPGIGVARYICDPDRPAVAEPAVAILDDYHGRGLGTLLLDLLIHSAVDHNVAEFRASVMDDNQAMRHMFERAGARLTRESPGVLCAEFSLPTRDRARLQLAHDLLRNFGDGSLARARRVLTGNA